MNSTLAIAAGTITLALVFYTIGVFAERRAGTLRPQHLAFFYLGLACDATGTSFMSLLAQGGVSTAHAVTGALALGADARARRVGDDRRREGQPSRAHEISPPEHGRLAGLARPVRVRHARRNPRVQTGRERRAGNRDCRLVRGVSLTPAPAQDAATLIGSEQVREVVARRDRAGCPSVPEWHDTHGPGSRVTNRQGIGHIRDRLARHWPFFARGYPVCHEYGHRPTGLSRETSDSCSANSTERRWPASAPHRIVAASTSDEERK